ncbi:MAG: hypothetical protein OER86_01180 [Phycisphaerae bacterium]|nr:hypothetical protein [Phycisphaerae bacterium]
MKDRPTAPPCLLLALCLTSSACAADPVSQSPTGPLTLTWDKNILTVHGEHLPGGQLKTWYLEAYCRPGSTDRQWQKTVIGHQTKFIRRSYDGRQIQLRCLLNDGVTVDHTITAAADEVDFRIVATNPTDQASQAHWAQPCIRVGKFTGLGDPANPRTYDYLKKSFVFVGGKLQTMPTPQWATEARYTPGQVWAAPGVPREDVNPRPLNPHTPSHGLIGCFSADDRMLMAVAFEPYQELFQGVITCLHSDFRIGGLRPGQSRRIRGKLYLLPNDIPALLKRYARDFPRRAGQDAQESRTRN